jgi:hypothetical protein
MAMDSYCEAGKLLDDVDEMHRLSPTERVARAQAIAALAQAEASQAIVEVLGRIADALDRAYPAVAASGPSALISRMVPRAGPHTKADVPGEGPANQSMSKNRNA